MTTRSVVDELVAEAGVEAAGVKTGVAALLYTYRCTIACRHCLFGCSPGSPRVHMATPQAVKHLHALHELGRVIHIAGGEAMVYWDDLRAVLEQSRAEGVQPHFIETNCSFAATDAIVAERLGVLKANGVAGILLSADPFHQVFVPPERFLRVRRQAYELFGERNVWCNRDPDEKIRGLPGIAADEGLLREYVRANPPTLVGTAHRELRGCFDAVPVGEGPTAGCTVEFSERIWEIHIDPYENIQTNCGVILGRADTISPAEIVERGPANANHITRLLADGGPLALAKLARDRHGFVVPERAASKCDLCYATRLFLRRFYPGILGPAEVYADPA
jgi:hypothetical protein